MVNKILIHKKSNIFLAIIFSIICNIVLLSNTTFASYNDMDKELLPTYSNHLSPTVNNQSTGEGLNSKILRIAVYTNQTTNNPHVYFDSGSCSSFVLSGSPIATNSSSISRYSNDNDPNNDPNVSALLTLAGRCSGNEIEMPISRFSASVKFPGYYVSLLTLKIGNSTIAPKFSVTGNNRLSYLGYPTNRNTPSSIQELSYAPGLSRDGSRGTITVRFAPPCNYGTHNVKLYWRDADSEKDANRSPGDPTEKVTYRIFDDTDDNYSMSSTKDADDATGVVGDVFTARQKHRYHVTFYNVKGNAANSVANAIQIWYPFSSSGYNVDCAPDPITGGWNLSWVSSFVRRSDGLNLGVRAGDPADPGNPDAPQPGQSFQFINDVRNGGDRSVSNGFWYCPISNSDHSKGQCWNGSPDRYWKLAPNTQTIAFDRGRTGYADDTISNAVTGTGVGGYINGPGWVWDNFGVAAADGGRTYCVNASLWPSHGQTINWTNKAYRAADKSGGILSPTMNNGTKTTDWNTPGPESRIYAPQLCVNVPFYYNLTPSVSVTGMQGGTVQQGTSPNVTATIHQDGATNGRNNTYSEAGKQKGLLQLQLAPGEVEPANKSAEALSTSDPTTWCKARTGNNADCTTPYTSPNVVGVPYNPVTNPNPNSPSENLTGTLNPNTDTLPVGTKLCYATYVQHPRNTESGDAGAAGDGRYSYSDIKCAIIVKSPKVQFLNTDVTVGRQSSAMAQCSENQVANAPIITTGSPENRSPSNLYGSWVEYGAFATGKITNFGSAAVPFGTTNEPRKLTFGNNGFNDSGNLGEFVYGKNCVADFFSMVKEDNTNLTSLGGAVFDPATGVLDLQQLGAGTDKTGYIAKDKNIQLGEPTTGSSAPDTTPAPTTQTIVRVNARAQNDVGNNGCPKLLVKVTDGGGHVDQDVKPICATGFQDYEYVFYQDTNGPKRVEARFINDGIVANVDRNIVLKTINVNGQDTYVSSRGSNPGSSIIGGGTSCMNSGNLNLYRSVSEGDPALNCFGVLIDPVTAPLAPAQQQADYAPPDETTVTVTARATLASSADGTSYAPNGGCPYMYVKVTGTNGIVREHTQAVCSTSQSPYSFTVNLGGGGVASVDASYDPMDYYGGGNDRNLYISNVKVGSTSIPINANSGTNVQIKNGTGGYVAMSSAPAICKDNNTVIFVSATNNVTDGYCASVRVLNITAPVPTPTPPPSLTSDYDGFKGRSIVIYAQKTTAGPCSSSSNGNITINKDLIYKKDGFGSVLDIPRITIIADCNITIADNVVDVNANLIAGDAIKTCTDKAQTQDKCNKKLTVRGAISANRLLLWRTYGADNSPGAPDPSYPAETFDLSPSQIISGYSRGARSATPSTVYEVDLPPRY